MSVSGRSLISASVTILPSAMLSQTSRQRCAESSTMHSAQMCSH